MAYNPISTMRQQPPVIPPGPSRANWRTSLAHAFKQHSLLYILLLPTLIWLIFLRLYPFYFASIAFVKYNPTHGFVTGLTTDYGLF